MSKKNTAETRICEALAEYDKKRKAEGYVVVYRRWCSYSGSDFWGGPKAERVLTKHVETLYAKSYTGLLVKAYADGSIAAFESVA